MFYPELTIIIPVFNAEKYLRKCIDSVLSQSYSSIEVLLIDDGSTDKSGVICDEYAQKDARVKVIHKKNEGVSIARNVGINKACGEYITFLDADDMMKEDCIACLMKAKDYPLVVCGYERFGVRTGTDGPHMTQAITISKDLRESWNKNAETWWWFVWGKLYRKDIIINNNLSFKSGMIYLEDFCFVLDYLCCIESVYLIKSLGILHLIEPIKYSKYRMDYSALKQHMMIHENSFRMLEQKHNTTFQMMREKIAYRHFFNFLNYLVNSDVSFLEKINNMYLYKKSDKRVGLFNNIKLKRKGKRVNVYWMLCNIVYVLFYPLLIVKQQNKK